jgi:hypothetical protein
MRAPNPNPSDDGRAFAEQHCLPSLKKLQNADGGWGFLPSSQSRVEPSTWALLALREFSSDSEYGEAIACAVRFLHSAQLPDGSWPSAPYQQQGTWVTALATWALQSHEESQPTVLRGLRWLIDERPGDSGRWRRLLRRLIADKNVVGHDEAYFGWSWTHGTASWVEPTSYALLALRHVPVSLFTEKLQRRLRVAKAMLCDRMCPGGGWNCGNPMVYGVPGEPQVGPTVWALLALGEKTGSPQIQQSLDWLEKNGPTVSSPASLALTQIGLNAYGRPTWMVRPVLRDLCASDAGISNVLALAWSTLAMSETRGWLKPGDMVSES